MDVYFCPFIFFQKWRRQWFHEYRTQWIKHSGKILIQPPTSCCWWGEYFTALLFLCRWRKLWFFWLSGRRKELVCLFWPDPVNWWPSWDHSKSQGLSLIITYCILNTSQLWVLHVPLFRVLEILQGKGAGKNGRFQGKANSLARRAEAEALLQQHCKSLTSTEE